MSLDPRFSIITTPCDDGTYSVVVTDYRTYRTETRYLFPSRAAAAAEGKQMVTAMRYGTGAVMVSGGAA
jgi:hypothetical protein